MADTELTQGTPDEQKDSRMNRMVAAFGRGASKFTSVFMESGRETLDVILHTLLPFMFFVSAIVGVVNGSGLGTIITNLLAPLASNIIGLIILGLICGIPVLSPILGPGAVIGQIIGTLIGTQIGAGAIPVQMALPALFAIDVQAGCDFIPVALGLMEAEPETIEAAVPAVLIGRFVTAPVGIILGYIISLFIF